MASIQEGPIVSAVRGSVEQVTFSKNQYGPIAYGKISPTFPNTSRQQQANGALRAAILRWQGLTDEQREMWGEAGKSGEWEFRNVMGKPYQPSGYQLFIKLNLSGAYFLRSFDEPPAKVVMPHLKLVSFSTIDASPTHDSDIEIVGDSFSTDFRLLLFTSASMSLGRTKPKPAFFRWTNSYSYSDLSPSLNYKWSYQNIWGATPNPDRIFIRLELVSLNSGERVSLGQMGNF